MYCTDLSSDINLVNGRAEVIVVMDLGMYLVSISPVMRKPEFASILKNYSKSRGKENTITTTSKKSKKHTRVLLK